MPVTVHAVRAVPKIAEAVIALVTETATKAGLTDLAVDEAMLASAGFEGKAGQVYSQPADGRVLGLVGLGSSSDITPVTLRRAGAAIARTWKRHRRVAVTLPSAADMGIKIAVSRQALAEGIILGNYRYTAYKSNNDSDTNSSRLRRVDVVGSTAASTKEALTRGAAIAAGVCLARDLVNEPGGSLTPTVFARRAAAMAKKAGLECEVWGQHEIKREKLGGLIGVNRGSKQPARFVQITYHPPNTGTDTDNPGDTELGDTESGDSELGDTHLGDVEPGDAELNTDYSGDAEPDTDHSGDDHLGDAESGTDYSGDIELGDAESGDTRPGGVHLDNREIVQARANCEQSGEATLAFVGKGLTFDAGGLSIKTAQGMMTMKMDMGGAAAVIGAMSVLPAVAPNVTVRAYLPMTDNMLGGDATRPGDVLTIRNGKTIEVANTDAEGRLVLADALTLASESEPDAIVDLATLTGACMVALGPRIAGLMGNNGPWVEQVRKAADLVGERVWPLPLPKDYESQFESTVADMKNIGSVHGGALTAGLILQKFVADGISWAHLDIAGPAFSDSEDGEICKGGTGFGVRTLVELAENFVKP